MKTTLEIREAFIRKDGWADQLRAATGDEERWQVVTRILNHLQPFYLNPVYLLEKQGPLDEYQGRVKLAIERAAIAQLSSDLAVRRAIEHIEAIENALESLDGKIKSFSYIGQVDLLSQRTKEVREKLTDVCLFLYESVKNKRSKIARKYKMQLDPGPISR